MNLLSKYPAIQKLFLIMLAFGALVAIFFMIRADKPRKRPAVTEDRQIAFVQNLTSVTRVIADTFKFQVNADSTVAKKVMYRDTFYLLRQPGYDSTLKKDTVYTYLIPKELVLIDKPKQ